MRTRMIGRRVPRLHTPFSHVQGLGGLGTEILRALEGTPSRQKPLEGGQSVQETIGQRPSTEQARREVMLLQNRQTRSVSNMEGNF